MEIFILKRVKFILNELEIQMATQEWICILMVNNIIIKCINLYESLEWEISQRVSN